MTKYEYWKPTNPKLRFVWVVDRELMLFTAVGGEAGPRRRWLEIARGDFTSEDKGATKISSLETKLRVNDILPRQ